MARADGGDRNGARWSGRIWPWGLALGVAALAVWLAVSFTGREGPPEPGEEPEPGVVSEDTTPDTAPALPAREPVTGAAAEELLARVEEMRDAVRSYEEECTARLGAATGEGLGALVAECVRRLGAAVDAVAATDTVGEVSIDRRLEAFREQVTRLQSIPPGEGRAAPTREVLGSVTDVLAVIRETRYPETLGQDGAVEDMRSALQTIDPDRPLDRQRQRVARFFLAAGGLLSAMARPGDPGPRS